VELVCPRTEWDSQSLCVDRPAWLGTQLALNSQRKGIIPGADVVGGHIAIWPGPDPINEALTIT
jgi:hypothetical protein